MSDPKSRVARDSEQLLDALEEVRSLEQEKRAERISTPRFHELADKITDKSRQVFRAAYREEQDGNKAETADLSTDDVVERDRSRPFPG